MSTVCSNSKSPTPFACVTDLLLSNKPFFPFLVSRYIFVGTSNAMDKLWALDRIGNLLCPFSNRKTHISLFQVFETWFIWKIMFSPFNPWHMKKILFVMVNMLNLRQFSSKKLFWWFSMLSYLKKIQDFQNKKKLVFDNSKILCLALLWNGVIKKER